MENNYTDKVVKNALKDNGRLGTSSEAYPKYDFLLERSQRLIRAIQRTLFPRYEIDPKEPLEKIVFDGLEQILKITETHPYHVLELTQRASRKSKKIGIKRDERAIWITSYLFQQCKITEC